MKFYKDNRVDGEYEVPVAQIIEDYYATERASWDMPFERKILNHMMDYGSFDVSDQDWEDLYAAKKEYDKQLSTIDVFKQLGDIFKPQNGNHE